MPYTVEIGRAAERDLKAITPVMAERIGERIEALADDPHPPQSRRLTGLPGFRLRVGDYRVMYEIDDAARLVTILRVRHRREAYR